RLRLRPPQPVRPPRQAGPRPQRVGPRPPPHRLRRDQDGPLRRRKGERVRGRKGDYPFPLSPSPLPPLSHSFPFPMALPAASDPAAVDRLSDAYARLRREVGRVIVGQEAVVEGLMVALLARGHVLLVGVPGLAKTLLIKTLAEAVDLSFSRIQFTDRKSTRL